MATKKKPLYNPEDDEEDNFEDMFDGLVAMEYSVPDEDTTEDEEEFNFSRYEDDDDEPRELEF